MLFFMCALNLISIYVFIMYKRLKYYSLDTVNPGSNCKSCEVDGVCRAFGDIFQKDCFTYQCRQYGSSWRAEVIKAGITFFYINIVIGSAESMVPAVDIPTFRMMHNFMLQKYASE